MNTVLLEARGIGKRFGGVKALKDVSLTIRSGEIYGLIGPNGAGKTTLFNVFTGLYPRDSGQVLFAGAPLSLEATSESVLFSFSDRPGQEAMGLWREKRG